MAEQHVGGDLGPEGKTFRKWRCQLCAFVYDEALGWPDEGIAPGTPWDAIPEDWVCPECGASKAEFDMVEITT